MHRSVGSLIEILREKLSDFVALYSAASAPVADSAPSVQTTRANRAISAVLSLNIASGVPLVGANTVTKTPYGLLSMI